jgi:hypothetical protein
VARLTKRIVDAIRPDPAGRSDVFAWDSELRGFGLRVKPSGSASFLIQYRNTEGDTRRLVVGKVGTLTPDEAPPSRGTNSPLRPRTAIHPPSVMPQRQR